LERREHTREPDPVKARGTLVFSAQGARFAACGVVLALAVAGSSCASTKGTIGAVLGQRADGRLFVREVPPKLAAAREGIRTGDEILLIAGRDVRSLSIKEVHHALEGDVGDRVKLTLVRGDTVVRATLRLTPAARFP
jgi:C-terminal processing protease CtpA/Prc